MIPNLEQTFRWFGPADEVTLADIKQTGAIGIVTALHHIPCGDVWATSEIAKRKALIEQAGLQWTVVESVNIHESIKIGEPIRDKYIDNYIQSLKNLAAQGIKTVCYNFMPVLDWTRTHLDFRLPNGASSLRYDAIALAAFDLYILNRAEAFNEFTPAIQQKAKIYLQCLTAEEKKTLTDTIMAGLPGTDEVFTVDEFKTYLQRYAHIGTKELKENLFYFLAAIMPEAEKAGIKMCIHPDDPPFPILGLPRVVSTEADLHELVTAVPSPSNGITFCTGSLGANLSNDLPGMVERLGSHIHFLHLRNVQHETDGSFHEGEHLGGSTDMYAVMKAVINEQHRRLQAGRHDVAIPMRPDHGHKLLDDFQRNTYPGYSVIGRLKGLAELRGLEMGIKRTLF